MSYERLAYDDQDTTVQMHSDCAACQSEMGLAQRPTITTTALDAPSIEFADFPREILKPEITVSDAAAHLAARIHLHWD